MPEINGETMVSIVLELADELECACMYLDYVRNYDNPGPGVKEQPACSQLRRLSKIVSTIPNKLRIAVGATDRMEKARRAVSLWDSVDEFIALFGRYRRWLEEHRLELKQKND